MQWIGHSSISRKGENVYFAGLYIARDHGRYQGGYGAEAYRLMCNYSVERLGAERLLANDTDGARVSALEEAGFRLVSAFPPQHSKRRRGYGIRRFEWAPGT